MHRGVLLDRALGLKAVQYGITYTSVNRKYFPKLFQTTLVLPSSDPNHYLFFIVEVSCRGFPEKYQKEFERIHRWFGVFSWFVGFFSDFWSLVPVHIKLVTR
jgi:hypothetical protein